MKKTLQIIAILAVAIVMASAWAHLLELPAKMVLGRDDYFTVQQIYRGWALLGIVVIGALVVTAALTWLERGHGRPFYFAFIATMCIALALVVFFSLTYPVNKMTENWTKVPEHWENLRRQWEYSHATGAALYFVALASLALSVVSKRI